MPALNHRPAKHVGALEDMSTADAAHGNAQQLRDGQGDHRALAQGLLLASADDLKLVSELVADQKARARLLTQADELIAFSEAWQTLD